MPENFFSRGLEALRGLLDFNQEPTSIREQIVQGLGVGPTEEDRDTARREIESLMERKRVQQPEPVLPGVQDLELEELEDYNPPEFEAKIEGFDIGTEKDFDIRTPGEMEYESMWQEAMNEEAITGISEETIGALHTSQEARRIHTEDVKFMENPDERGLVKGPTEALFMPIKSSEGQGPDKMMSDMEIGYGVKIPKSWLSDNKSKWPKIDGVEVDVRKGFTKDQATSIMQTILDESYDVASKKLDKWDDMTEREKSYWADLTYNGGNKAIDKNPKAKAAANDGRTVEAMIKSLDFIGAGGKKSRGLLNRRVTMYNQAALEVPGAPIIEQYEFGETIRVKFSSRIMTRKVGQKFAKKINDEGGWFTVTKGDPAKRVSKTADENYKFIG